MSNVPHPRSRETPSGVAVDHLDDDWTTVTVQGWDFEVLLAVDPHGEVQLWAFDPRDRPETLVPVAVASFDVYAALRRAPRAAANADRPGSAE